MHIMNAKYLDEEEYKHRKTLKSQLKLFIENKNFQGIDILLSIEKNLNILRSEKHFDPFVIAIKSNQIELIDYLLEKGFKLNGQSKETSVPITSKINSEKQPMSTELIAEFINKRKFGEISEEDFDFTISTSGESASCELNKTESGLNYSNPLIEAIKCCNYDCVKRLVDFKVCLDSNNYKYIPLQIAYNLYSQERDKRLQPFTWKFEATEKILRYLITNKINVNIYNNKGLRLIHQIVLDKDLDLLQFMLNECKTNINTNTLTYGKMQNALHLVSEVKKFSTNKITANSSGTRLDDSSRPLPPEQVNWTNNKSKLDVHNVNLARCLIKAGCNINHRDYQSHETPVFKAIEANNYDLVKLFIIEGVDLSMRNLFGNDVLSRSIQLGRFKIARLLVIVDSPIRLFSLFYNVPSVEILTSSNSFDQSDYRDYDFNAESRESFLQHSLSKYEEFLTFLQKYTHKPRSLKDLSRLCVRNLMKKPISKSVDKLGLVPSQVIGLILLNDIDEMI